MLSLGSPSVQALLQHLSTSLRLRARTTPISGEQSSVSPRVAILFSGGLDCTLIARVIHDILPPQQEVDLLNVAFENPRVSKAAKATQDMNAAAYSPYELCPDRLTGRSSHQELAGLCRSRSWRFVSIDIPYKETVNHRDHIRDLLLPHNTEMDFSIGCALYFAARGCGNIQCPAGRSLPYTTPCRVLLSGLGADEIFGGYHRHAVAFGRRGYSGLVEELQLDLERLGQRNLGRDDRIISHWGKEVRYPYLDEDLLAWAAALPVAEKCNFGEKVQQEPNLEASKRLLRLLAWSMGLRGAAVERKRAIQFGARTAKMLSGRTRGTEVLA